MASKTSAADVAVTLLSIISATDHQSALDVLRARRMVDPNHNYHLFTDDLNSQLNVIEGRAQKSGLPKGTSALAKEDITTELEIEFNMQKTEITASEFDLKSAADPTFHRSFVQRLVAVRGDYAAPYLSDFALVKKQLEREGVRPFDAVAKIARIPLREPTQIATTTIMVNAAREKDRVYVFDTLTENEPLHALRARTLKDSESTFVRFLVRARDRATPSGISVYDAVTGLPADRAFDKNASYFVNHPRMLSMTARGDDMLKLARTYEHAHYAIEAHRGLKDARDEAKQERMLALAATHPSREELYAGLNAIRTQSNATSRTPKREKENRAPRTPQPWARGAPVRSVDATVESTPAAAAPVTEPTQPKYSRIVLITDGKSKWLTPNDFSAYAPHVEQVYLRDSNNISNRVTEQDLVLVIANPSRQTRNLRAACRDAGASYFQTDRRQPHVVMTQFEQSQRRA